MTAGAPGNAANRRKPLAALADASVSQRRDPNPDGSRRCSENPNRRRKLVNLTNEPRVVNRSRFDVAEGDDFVVSWSETGKPERS
jgi:hypothetical protein